MENSLVFLGFAFLVFFSLGQSLKLTITYHWDTTFQVFYPWIMTLTGRNRHSVLSKGLFLSHRFFFFLICVHLPVFSWILGGILCRYSKFSLCSIFLSKFWTANSGHFALPEPLVLFPQPRESIGFCLNFFPYAVVSISSRQLTGATQRGTLLFPVP